MKWTLLGVLFLSSCTASFEQVAPKPRVAVAGFEDRTLGVALGLRVEEVQRGQSVEGCPDVEAESWRASLADGFVAGFTDGFTLSEGESPGEYTLTILDAVPSMKPMAVGWIGLPTACTLVVEYTAVLRGPGGSEALTGEAEARYRDGAEAHDLASAIEVMYEQIARRFFPLPPQRPLAEGR